MGGAIAWYQSRTVWGGVAAILILAATHFGVTLPTNWTKDNIIDFFLVAVPVAIAIEGRISSTKVIAPTAAKAAAINATTVVTKVADAPAAPGQTLTGGPAILPMLLALLMLGVMAPTLIACTNGVTVNSVSAQTQGSLDALYIAASGTGAAAVVSGKMDKAHYKALDNEAYNALLAVRAARKTAVSTDILTATVNFNNAIAALRAAIPG